MDIFTTQLRRVVPVRIKPEKLKVKALAKDDKVGKLSEEQDQSIKDEVDIYIHAERDESDQEEMLDQQGHQSSSTESSEKDNQPHKGTKLDIFV